MLVWHIRMKCCCFDILVIYCNVWRLMATNRLKLKCLDIASYRSNGCVRIKLLPNYSIDLCMLWAHMWCVSHLQANYHSIQFNSIFEWAALHVSALHRAILFLNACVWVWVAYHCLLIIMFMTEIVIHSRAIKILFYFLVHGIGNVSVAEGISFS